MPLLSNRPSNPCDRPELVKRPTLVPVPRVMALSCSADQYQYQYLVWWPWIGQGTNISTSNPCNGPELVKGHVLVPVPRVMALNWSRDLYFSSTPCDFQGLDKGQWERVAPMFLPAFRMGRLKVSRLASVAKKISSLSVRNDVLLDSGVLYAVSQVWRNLQHVSRLDKEFVWHGSLAEVECFELKGAHITGYCEHDTTPFVFYPTHS